MPSRRPDPGSGAASVPAVSTARPSGNGGRAAVVLPLAFAGWSCTLALLLVPASPRPGWSPPQLDGLSWERLARLVARVLGGAGFIAAINVAVSLSGPTITGFVSPLYAVLATLFAVPVLREPVRVVRS